MLSRNGRARHNPVRLDPFDHRRVGIDGVRIGLGNGTEARLVGGEARSHRGEHDVGVGETAEQEIATVAESLAAVALQGVDTGDVGQGILGQAPARIVSPAVHGHIAAHIAETTMHFGTHDAGMGSRRRVVRP